MKLFQKLTKVQKVLILVPISLILIGVISANGNFKVDTEGNMECTNGTFNGTVKGSTIEGSKFNFKNEDGSTININGYGISATSTKASEEFGLSPEIRVEDANGSFTRLDAQGVKITSLKEGIFAPSVNLTDSKENQVKISTEGLLANTVYDSPIKIFYKEENKYWNGLMGDKFNKLVFDEELNNPKITFKGMFGTCAINTSWQSDRRLKKDIKDTSVNGIDVIKQLKHKEFKWKRTNGENKCGYIAQDLEKINPEFVSKIAQEDGTETYQVEEYNIIPYITKALQESIQKQEEQQQEIENLKQEINKLKEAR